MRFIQVISIILIVLLVQCIANAETKKYQYKCELTDPAGDLEESNKDKGKDIVKLNLNSDGKELHVTAHFKDKLSTSLNKDMAGAVMRLNIDTDNKATTGGKPFFSQATGFEYIIKIYACISYGDQGEACSGSLEKVKPVSYFSSFIPEKYQQDSNTSEGKHDFRWQSPHKDIKDTILEVSIPYAEMGVKSGQTVRFLIREEDSFYNEKGFFPEFLFTFK